MQNKNKNNCWDGIVKCMQINLKEIENIRESCPDGSLDNP